MAAQEALARTPKKVHNKSRSIYQYCRLCNDNSTRLSHIFTKSGIAKKYQQKIHEITGIKTQEDDFLSTAICRNCERRIESIWVFRNSSRTTQVELLKNFSIKRQHFSPAGVERKQDQLLKSNTTASHQPRKKLAYGDDVNNNVQHIHPKEQNVNIINNEQYNLLCSSILTRKPDVIADSICSIPSLLKSVKLLLIQEIEKSAKSLCRRDENGSKLLDKSYISLAEFSPEKLWKELKSTQPFLINILNAISGKLCDDIDDNDDDKTPNQLKIKYVFIYSILMNMRWHELSLFQRVNSILLVEGGCSKQVIFFSIIGKYK